MSSRLLHKISYKILPSQADKAQDICYKIQSIIDRRNRFNTQLMKNKITVENKYISDINFYSTLIPDFDKKILSKLQNAGVYSYENDLIINNYIDTWINKNMIKCADFLSSTGKDQKLKIGKAPQYKTIKPVISPRTSITTPRTSSISRRLTLYDTDISKYLDPGPIMFGGRRKRKTSPPKLEKIFKKGYPITFVSIHK